MKITMKQARLASKAERAWTAFERALTEASRCGVDLEVTTFEVNARQVDEARRQVMDLEDKLRAANAEILTLHARIRAFADTERKAAILDGLETALAAGTSDPEIYQLLLEDKPIGATKALRTRFPTLGLRLAFAVIKGIMQHNGLPPSKAI